MTAAAGPGQYVAYVTKGLADVAAAELAEIIPPGAVAPPQERYVLVTATAQAAGAVLARARTVDDFRLLVAGPCQVADEPAFRRMCAAAAERTRAVLDSQPDCAGLPWSVTLSARRPPWSAGTWQPAPAIAEALPGADLTARQRSPADLRIQADGKLMHVALSLAGRPAGKRDDRTAGPGGPRPGALRPTVAAAMLWLALAARPVPASRQRARQQSARQQSASSGSAGPGPADARSPQLAGPQSDRWQSAGSGSAGSGSAGRRAAPAVVYDPCAGTGTIPAEAMALGLAVFASDIDPQAVQLTRQRLAWLSAGRSAGRGAGRGTGGWAEPGGDAGSLVHRVFVHDVRAGASVRVRADLVVSNLPWGQQVAVPSRRELFDGVAQVVRAAVTDGGAAVLLSTHEQQLRARLERALPGARLTQRRIGLLGQTPAIVIVTAP